MDLVGEGFDSAIRVGKLPDSNMIARHIGAIQAKLVASLDYIRRYGARNTPDELLSHEALMQETDSWQFLRRR